MNSIDNKVFIHLHVTLHLSVRDPLGTIVDITLTVFLVFQQIILSHLPYFHSLTYIKNFKKKLIMKIE